MGASGRRHGAAAAHERMEPVSSLRGFIMSWGGVLMFIPVGFTAFLHLQVVYCFCKRNSRQTLSGEFNNTRETKQIPGTNYLKFCMV